MITDYKNIVQHVVDLFAAADDQQWKKAEALFSDDVLYDYTSLNGGMPSRLSGKEIVKSWSAFLPGFDKTQHRLINIRALEDPENDGYRVRFTGKADHFIDGKTWSLVGNYEARLSPFDDDLQIYYLKMNLISQTGDLNLPKEAKKRIKH